MRSFPWGLAGTCELEGWHTQGAQKEPLLGICETWGQKGQASTLGIFRGGGRVKGAQI